MFVPRIEIEPVVSEIELLALLMLSSYVLYNSQNFVMFKANESPILAMVFYFCQRLNLNQFLINEH